MSSSMSSQKPTSPPATSGRPSTSPPASSSQPSTSHWLPGISRPSSSNGSLTSGTPIFPLPTSNSFSCRYKEADDRGKKMCPLVEVRHENYETAMAVVQSVLTYLKGKNRELKNHNTRLLGRIAELEGTVRQYRQA
ncbi:unnamed protein product [Clavelina lepadiformis]|uniref:Uncharacterized protein n=1 Tax=Clavelina lepadiformis TaxID=159417 RepID=A0ABP0GSH4_CLALP